MACATDAPLASLLESVHQCQKDALFLATLGQKLNGLGRYHEAVDHLERALMLEPGLKDAQLSYAIALTGLGDLPSAQALLDDLLRDPGLPAPLRVSISVQRDVLAQSQTEASRAGAFASALAAARGWQSRASIGARLGYDSNLLGAPNLESLTLTFSDQTLNLPLDESYLARGGNYIRVEGQLDLHRTEAGGARWDLTAALRSRDSAAVANTGSTQVDLSLERSDVPDLLGHYVNISTTQLRPQIGSRYTAAGIAAGWAGSWYSGWAQNCQARAGLEAQERNYADVAVLSGRYTGFSASLTCDTPIGPQWALGLRSGHDVATDASRPGGDQTQTSIRGNIFLPMAQLPVSLPLPYGLPGGAAVLSYEYAIQDDSSGYTPYLDSGRTRSVNRQAARVEFQQPVSRNAQWVFGVDWLRQISSLALFQQQSWGASLGYRMGW
jgi:hypothetical protein